MLPLLAVTVVTVNVALLAYLSGTVMPLATGLLTHFDADARLKAIINLVLSLVAGVIAAFIAHQGTLQPSQILTAAVQAYVASGVSYVALWKPTRIAPAVNLKGLSIGGPVAPAPISPGPVPLGDLQAALHDPANLAADGDQVVDGIAHADR